MCAQAMSSVLDAFARMGCYNPNVLQRIADHATSHAHEISGRHLACMLWGFSRLAFHDTKVYQSICGGLRSKIGDLSAKVGVVLTEGL